MGRPMNGKTQDFTVKLTASGAGQFFTGLENLAVSASDTAATLSYSNTAFAQPEVSVMVDAFANAGPAGTIPLQAFKYEEAAAEAFTTWAGAIYGTGSGNQPLGLGAIVDDGTNNSSIGGLSRSTYTNLKATVTAASTLTLAALGTLEDTIEAAGIESEMVNINVTTKPVLSLYEQLLSPQVRADYQTNGGAFLPLRGNVIGSARDFNGQAGFTSFAHRGNPAIADDAATTGVWFKLNERYFGWYGRTEIPDEYQGKLEKINLGENKILVGVAALDQAPPKTPGWFYQPKQLLPQQAGMVGRIFVIGQVCGQQFRRQGKLTGVTTV